MLCGGDKAILMFSQHLTARQPHADPIAALSQKYNTVTKAVSTFSAATLKKKKKAKQMKFIYNICNSVFPPSYHFNM